ncbi:MAG TPA: ABC transporter substrate-binding protein [Acidimicrobiales bacterium]|nr:ABC transporter substrate-binding protein [Acidimicrobiales bacterium]
MNRPPVRSRLSTYRMVMGATAATLLVGLALPFIVADAEEASVSASAAQDFGALSTDETIAPGSSDSTAGPGATDVATGAIAGQRNSSNAAGSRPGATSTAPRGPVAVANPNLKPIKVGFLLLDLAGAAGLGFPAVGSVDEQRAIYQRFTDDANAAGGIGGRPIQAVYTTFDPLRESSMRDACLTLTDDEEVFVAISAGGFSGDSILCVTQEHRTPLLSGVSGAPMEFYAKSAGLLFTQFWNSDRMVANLAHEAHQLGALKNKTVGILYDLRYGPASVAEQLKRNVESLGYKVGRVSIFSADLSEASTQVPIELNQQKSAGVEVILNMANAVLFTQFVQQADGQQWIKPYYNSDWNGANSDFFFSNLPDSYDGNVNFTIARVNEGRAGLAEPAIDTACRRQAEKALGRSLPQDDPENLTFDRSCSFFQLMVKGLLAAGPSPTAQSFSQGLQNLGKFDLPNMFGATLAPGRFDYGTTVRTMQWKTNCKCIIPVTGFRAAKF